MGGGIREPGKTSQSRIPASILAQGLFAPKSLFTSSGFIMLANFLNRNRRSNSQEFATWTLAIIVSLSFVSGVIPASGQDQSQAPPQTDNNGKPKQDAPADVGGPGGDIGPYAIPKKKTEEAPPPPQPVSPKKVEGIAKFIFFLVLGFAALLIIGLARGDGLPGTAILTLDLRQPVADSATSGLSLS